MAMEALKGFPRHVARRRGGRRRGGASELVGEARERGWLQHRWPVATVALGRERESEGEESGGLGESERVQGVHGIVRAFQGDKEDARQAGRRWWRGCGMPAS